MKILVVSSTTPATGNEITMQRICSFFTDTNDAINLSSSSSSSLSLGTNGTVTSVTTIPSPDSTNDVNPSIPVSIDTHSRLPWTVIRLDCNKTTTEEIQRTIDTEHIDVLILVHAYRSGQYLPSLRLLLPSRTTTNTHSNPNDVFYSQRIPVILMLSGTDVNELFVTLGEKYETMVKNSSTDSSIDPNVRSSSLYKKTTIALQACALADRIVSLTPEMAEGFRYACQYLPLDTLVDTRTVATVPFTNKQPTLQELRTIFASKLRVIRQGMIPPIPLPSTLPISTLSFRNRLGIPANSFVCCLVSGLREVKDPFYLLPAFLRWIRKEEQEPQQKNRRNNIPIYWVTIGPPLVPSVTQTMYDYTHAQCIQTYAQSTPITFPSSVSSSSSSSTTTVPLPNPYYGGKDHIFYHPPVDRDTLLHYITQCNVFFNTSISEGESNALLEAMACRIPVIARKNTGNQSIIEHNRTGYLFSTPDEGITLCRYVYQQYCVSLGHTEYPSYPSDDELSDEPRNDQDRDDGRMVKHRLTHPTVLTQAAYEYIEKEHSNDQERRLWLQMVHEVYQERYRER